MRKYNICDLVLKYIIGGANKIETRLSFNFYFRFPNYRTTFMPRAAPF